MYVFRHLLVKLYSNNCLNTCMYLDTSFIKLHNSEILVLKGPRCISEYGVDPSLEANQSLDNNQKIHVLEILGHQNTCFFMRNLNFWSKFFILNF